MYTLWGRMCSGILSLLHYKCVTMAKSKRVFPVDREYAKQQNLLNKLLDILDDADTLHNAIQIATSKTNKVASLMEDYENLVTEICELTGTKNIGAAKKRISAVMKKAPLGVAEKFELDTTFLDKPSPAWKVKLVIEDDNWEKKKLEWDRTKERWRKSASNMYSSYLDEVLKTCAEEQVEDEELPLYIKQAHDHFREVYLTVSYVELFRQFDEEIDINLEVVQSASMVDFADCLAFTKDYTFQKLWKELNQQSSTLGQISKMQFDRYESVYTTAQGEPYSAGYPKLRDLAKRITAAMIERFVGGESWPRPEDESRLLMLLSTADEDQRAEDWDIDDSTPLTKFVAFYSQLQGARI